MKENKFKLIKGEKPESTEEHLVTIEEHKERLIYRVPADAKINPRSLDHATQGVVLRGTPIADECKGIWLGMTLRCEFCKHVWQDSVHESHVFIRCPGCGEVTNIIGAN